MVTVNLFSYQLGERRGFIIQREEAYGDVAPLSGRSRESWEETRQQLIALRQNPSLSPLFPSVEIGWKFAQEKRREPSTAPLAGLLLGDKEAILAKAKKLQSAGFSTIKVKIAHLSHTDARDILRFLCSTFHVRVDLNRSWSYQEALSFFSYFGPHDFAFIEEPSYEVDKLREFPFPIAWDESLLDYPLEWLLSFPSLAALTVKPTILGNFCQTLAQHKIPLVFSSAYESGLGLIQIARFAQSFEQPVLPLGIDTCAAEDLLVERLDFSQPTIQLPQEVFLHHEYLHPIP